MFSLACLSVCLCTGSGGGGPDVTTPVVFILHLRTHWPSSTDNGVFTHCPTKRSIQRPTKMGCIEFIIICVGVGFSVSVGVGQSEHTIYLGL